MEADRLWATVDRADNLLERWLPDGGRLAGLAAELEAALVHVRTPARFA